MITEQDIQRVEALRCMVKSSDASVILITEKEWKSMSKIATAAQHKMTADEVEKLRSAGLL